VNAPPSDPGNPDGQGRAVLLAEDSPSVLLLARSLLARWGFAVTACKCDETAVQALEGGGFDLVVIGASSPNAEMVADVAAGKAPVLALVSNGLSLAQAADFLEAPFSAAGLRDAVRSCLMAEDQDIDVEALAGQWESLSSPAFRRIARVFIAEMRDRMRLVEEYHAKGSLMDLEIESHGIKGAASNLAAPHLRNTAARVEAAAAGGDAAALPSLIAALSAAGLRAIIALQRLLDSEPSHDSRTAHDPDR